MMNYKLASKYAQALIQLAGSPSKIRNYLEELEQLVDLLRAAPNFAWLLYHPCVTHFQKKKALKNLLSNHLDTSLLLFLFVLIDKKRIQYLPDIVREYRHLAHQQLKVLDVQVITAVPLEEQEELKLKTKLENFYHKSIQIKSKIDPKIIGGMILMLNNQMVDNSIKNQLVKLKENLLANRAEQACN
jgi:F-type H+-transporting ATPase subunit delta